MSGKFRHFPKSYMNEFPLWSRVSMRKWYFLVIVIKCLTEGAFACSSAMAEPGQELSWRPTSPAPHLAESSDFAVEYRFPMVAKSLHYAKTLLALHGYCNNHNFIGPRRFQYFPLPLFTVFKFSKLVIKKHNLNHNLIIRPKLDR